MRLHIIFIITACFVCKAMHRTHTRTCTHARTHARIYMHTRAHLFCVRNYERALVRVCVCVRACIRASKCMLCACGLMSMRTKLKLLRSITQHSRNPPEAASPIPRKLLSMPPQTRPRSGGV